MIQNSLVKYIREQLRAGYDTSSIKAYLLRYGYSEGQINEAFQYAYPPSAVKHIIHLSKTTVVVVIALICSLLLIAGGIYTFISRPRALLDVEVSLGSDSIRFGEDLGFTVTVSNLGSGSRFDVNLRYEVYDLRDNVMKFEEETMAVETKASKSVSMRLGDLQPGSYYLRVTALYKDKSAKASGSFKVLESLPTSPTPVTPTPISPTPTTPQEQCPVSCDDNNKCTNDYCSANTNFVCNHDKITPCCGNGICEDNEECAADCETGGTQTDFGDKPVWEVIDIIGEMASRDKNGAVEECKGISQLSFRYDCWGKVAIASNDNTVCDNIADESYKDTCEKDFATTLRNSEVCAEVVKESKRDQCYMDFATKGDYTVCDMIVNKYYQLSCESLRKLSEVEITSQ
jgi:hypothetical protein